MPPLRTSVPPSPLRTLLAKSPVIESLAGLPVTFWMFKTTPVPVAVLVGRLTVTPVL